MTNGETQVVQELKTLSQTPSLKSLRQKKSRALYLEFVIICFGIMLTTQTDIKRPIAKNVFRIRGNTKRVSPSKSPFR